MRYSERFNYRGQSFPLWWEEYLPAENNPYEKDDTLTLEPGCMKDYWYFHSSNRHPNYKGRESQKLVQGLALAWFGSVFTSGLPYSVGAEGYKNCIRCKYARIGEDRKIHIDDAYNYYEYVIKFVMAVLREVSMSHLPSADPFYADDRFFSLIIQISRRSKVRKEKKDETAYSRRK